MPIFEYECKDCAHKFEFLHLSRNEKVNCPECNSERVTRLFSVFGYIGGAVAAAASNDKDSSKCSSCSSQSCATCK